MRGLSQITPNQQNLPFQIKWCNNRIFNPQSAVDAVIQFKKIFRTSALTWQESFLFQMRSLSI